MAQVNATAAIGLALGAFAIGMIAGRAIPSGEPTGAGPATDQQLIAPPLRAAAGDDAAVPRRAFQEIRADDAPRPQEDAPTGFAFSRLKLEAAGAAPRACLEFTDRLVDDASVDYGDYVRTTPDDAPGIAVAGSTLCLDGLKYNVDYAVRLRAGLPGADDQRLLRAEEVAVAFGDKPAYVGFAGDGVVLPRQQADGLGLETVNVDTLKITVSRVSDRSLVRKRLVAGQALGERDYGYLSDQERGDDVGVEVFQTELAVEGAPNETTTTVFPLGAALNDLKPGAYFVRLEDASPGADRYRPANAWRWIVYTDMALTTVSGAGGLDVFVRSLGAARPIGGVELVLLAENNDVLARARTNADGRAAFERALLNGEGPLRPRLVTAYGPQDDFAALDLQRAPLDLSDENVGGRDGPTADLDAFVYLERGVYRPGETVRITGLVRDANARAVDDRPVTLTIMRPNGTLAHEERIADFAVGGFTAAYETPAASPRGRWRLVLEADGAGPIAETGFSVEDFVPQRLEVAVLADEDAPMAAGEARPVTTRARFLYGAPAGDLTVEAEARVRVDPNPFPTYKDYRFGPVTARFEERFLRLPNTTTDGDGESAFDFALPDLARDTGLPLRADLVVGVVEPGGRVVRESAFIPVRPDAAYVGLALADGARSFATGQDATIDAVLLDRDGAPVGGELEWRLVEEDYWFDWYRERGRWRWRRSYRDVPVAEGRELADVSGGARIVRRLDPGSYRLAVTHPKSGARSSVRFYVGWRGQAAGADKPDVAVFSVPDRPLKPGGRVSLRLTPPYEGEAIVTVATDRVHDVQRVRVGPDGGEIVIDTQADWGPGFYVLASVVTERRPADLPAPRRAMGVAYVPFDMSDRELTVEVGAPELIAPRRRLDLPLRIAGARRGEDVMVTVNAVDQGILRLTKHAAADPVDHYFGKRRLGVAVRDDYNRILNANLGAPARFGGDQIGGEGLTVVPTKSVALFSGVLRVGADGKASAPIDIPDFNGELRLDVIAWSQDRLGAATQALTVRDATPTLLALPRFLAPGDTARATLSIDNVDGPAGAYEVTLSGTGPVALDETQTFTLAPGERKTATFSLSAQSEGVGGVELSVVGPDAARLSRVYDIQTRTPFYPVTNRSTALLEPGEAFRVDKALLAPFAPGSAAVTLSFSALSGVEPGPLLEALNRYPYGCTEQLVSTAAPLLSVDLVGAAAGEGPDRAVRPRVQKAVNTLLSRQGSDGAFGLWRPGDANATPWIGVYATDFLFRAKAAGYAVADDALERAYRALQALAEPDRWAPVSYRLRVVENERSTDTTTLLRRRAAAYAHYVLARAGRADLSDLRYFHDALLGETPSPLARAHIAAALTYFGDNARATNAFAKAQEALGYDNPSNYYQSALRDAAGVLALAAEAGRAGVVEQTAEDLADRMRAPDALHTQEKAFVLKAAEALLAAAGPVSIDVDGEALPAGPAPSVRPAIETVASTGVTARNIGDGPVFRTVTVSGAPTAPPAPIEAGFKAATRYARLDGAPADPSALRQNDRIVVVISGQARAERLHPAIVADLLPPGLEIEAVLTPADGARAPQNGGRADGAFAWIGPIARTKVAEARDDRFVAALDVRDDPFTLAYVARAVTPGDYLAPGVVIEDMYRPGVVGRTAASRLTVAAPSTDEE
ncbi:MAG: alpha-2-macroglobulin [Pseudomonadota bacterium]